LRWEAGYDSAVSIAIDFGIKMISSFTGAVPEFYFVTAVAVEKRSEKVCNGNEFTLARLR